MHYIDFESFFCFNRYLNEECAGYVGLVRKNLEQTMTTGCLRYWHMVHRVALSTRTTYD